MAAVASSSLPSATAADPWRALAAANRADELCQAWLVVLAASLTQARAGLLLLAQADGAYAPVAAVPPTRDLSYLSEIATDALRSREGVVRHDELGHARLAYPLQLAADKVAGAVVLDLGPVDAAALERALRLTHWGCASAKARLRSPPPRKAALCSIPCSRCRTSAASVKPRCNSSTASRAASMRARCCSASPATMAGRRSRCWRSRIRPSSTIAPAR
jgi:hypothetical protein